MAIDLYIADILPSVNNVKYRILLLFIILCILCGSMWLQYSGHYRQIQAKILYFTDNISLHNNIIINNNNDNNAKPIIW